MVRQILTLPLRTGARLTGLALGATARSLRAAAQTAQIAEVVLRGAARQAMGTPPASAPAAPATSAPQGKTSDAAAAPPEAPSSSHAALTGDEARGVAIPQPPSEAVPVPAEVSDEAVPVTEEPAHVSEEPVLVEEFAEPGAEDGAGAEIRVDEPWSGYAKMNADEVVARLGEADEAELAAVQLYEGGHRQREMVLAAVERQFKLVSRGGAQ